MEERYFTKQQAAEILGVSTRTVTGMMEKGQLQGYKAGRGYRIPESSINALMNTGKDPEDILSAAVKTYGLRPETTGSGIAVIAANSPVPLQKLDRLIGNSAVDVSRAITETESGSQYHYNVVFPESWVNDMKGE